MTLMACVAAVAASPPSIEKGDLAVPAPDWDSVFARTEGWTGGDAMYSVPLGEDRTLWLFADSWVGRVADGKHADGSRLINNAIAVHPTPMPGQPPAPESLKFHWGPNDEKGFPTAWIKPTISPLVNQATVKKKPSTETWYWVADGILAPAPSGGERLLVFLWHIGRKAGAKGVWSFESVGGALAIVQNPHDPVASWRVTQMANPHAVGAAKATADPALNQISWGSEVLLMPSRDGKGRPRLYIYGVRETAGWNKQLVLARAPAERVEDFTTWRFRTDAGWSPSLEDAISLADGVANEYSVHRFQVSGKITWVMIHSEPLFGPHIMCRTASAREGPWSESQPIYDVPGLTKNKDYFTYAAKGHDHLSAPGKLLITYIINAHDFGAMVRDANIYRPRFVTLDLDRLPSAD